jgi:hypothetical protein
LAAAVWIGDPGLLNAGATGSCRVCNYQWIEQNIARTEFGKPATEQTAVRSNHVYITICGDLTKIRGYLSACRAGIRFNRQYLWSLISQNGFSRLLVFQLGQHRLDLGVCQTLKDGSH